ncbi:class A sortase [Facklamia miroungae]|uniref:Sortase A n=1 Tax=Facklamia miroungae TaxID=120956 RepID=A0A1G7S0P6_9LACT|nr:class A sortase [Facklamia miroungae]NKZ29208.1 class A sortase [Facklamia miroungae]SDG16588.1 sortase A [Facklamia miroungae]
MSRNQQHTPSRSRKHRKRKRGFSFSTFLGILLIIVALGLLLVNPLKNYLIQNKTNDIQISNLTREQIVANQQKDVSFDFTDIQSVDPFTVISSSVNPKDLPVIGGISIPELKINLPINKGTSNEGMFFGAGTLSADQKMGESNYALASHHMYDQSLLFSPLKDAKKGQKIFMTDLDNVYVYEISSVLVVDPSAVEVLNPSSEPIVTLVTCTQDFVDRIIVQGELKEKVPISEATIEMMDAFKIERKIATNS